MEQYLDYIDTKRAEAYVTSSKGPVKIVYETSNVLLVHSVLNIEKRRGLYYPRYDGSCDRVITVHESWLNGEQQCMEIWRPCLFWYEKDPERLGRYEFENGKIVTADGPMTFEKKGSNRFITKLCTGSSPYMESVVTDELNRRARGYNIYYFNYSFANGVRPLRICEQTSQIILMPNIYAVNMAGCVTSLRRVELDTCIDLTILCSIHFNQEGNTLSGRFVCRLRCCMRRWLMHARQKRVQTVLIKPLAAIVCSYI